MGGNSGKSFDQLKRSFNDFVRELHAHKLAIPAGAVLVLILAAIFMLPKSSTPPPPATAAPVANAQQPVETEAVVSLKLVGVTPLDNDVPLADSSDPFHGSDKPKCVRVGSGTPKKFDCKIGDLLFHYTCMAGETEGICGSTEGASGATGGSTAATGGSTGSTGSSGGSHHSPAKKAYVYVAGVTLDGRKYKSLVAGDGVPNDKSALATYAGATSSHNKAIFILGDSATATGVVVDDDLGSFELAKGQTVTITDKLAAEHTLTLNSITKVKK